MSVEPTQIDLSAVNAMTERLENVIDEVRKPSKVEHQHRHAIDIGSSKVFLSMVVMVLVIFGLSYAIGEQRRRIWNTGISRCKDSNEENLYRLGRQFKYNDSIKIIRKQAEKYRGVG